MINNEDVESANIAVCGRFHYNHYVKYLDELGGLNRFYYSGKVSLSADKLGIAKEKAKNIFLKEYLIHLHIKVFNNRWMNQLFPIYHDVWQRGVLKNWKSAPILHYMLHGNGERIISRAHKDGSLVVGEPVNSHPLDLNKLLNEEHELLGINGKINSNILDQRIAEETESCDYIVAGSSVIKNSYVRSGFPKDKVFVIPFGTDTQRFSPLTQVEKDARVSGLEEKSFRVISVGSITPRKGHIYLLEAWKKLAIPDSELLLVGQIDPCMEPVLKKYSGQFTHVPHVPHEMLRHYYGVSDLFVLPSIEDGFAYVCIEALGCGLPVITTQNTGAGEQIDEGINGYIVPIRSSEAIEEKMYSLYKDKELRRDMARSAVEKATSKLLWSDYAKELLSVYQKLR